MNLLILLSLVTGLLNTSPHLSMAHQVEPCPSTDAIYSSDTLEGKYAEPGGYVVDHALIKKDDLWHLIYIRGIAATNWPEYPLSNFGHAVSHDLEHWDTKKPVLETLEDGFDSYQVWAPPESPFVVKKNGLFYLFYTNYTHGIGYLTSPDPNQGWKENPEDPQSILKGVSATEIFQENGTWYITLISHMNNGLHFFEIRELIWNADGTVTVSTNQIENA